MLPFLPPLRKWCLLLLGISTASCVLAQEHNVYGGTPPMTLHVIYSVTDFPTDSIFVGCQKDKAHALDLFTAIGEAARDRGYPLTVKQHPLPWFHKANTMNYLANLDTQPNDGVILLYSGHGYNPDMKEYKWPRLWYCSEEEVDNPDLPRCEVSLRTLHDFLRQEMGVRMSMVIGSSCNDDISGRAAQQVARAQQVEALAPPEDMAQCNNFDLFLDYEGHIMSSASGPGQVAYLNDSIGSYYVHAFLTVLSEGLTSSKRVTWPSIFRRTKEVVRHVRKKEQDPQFQIAQGTNIMLSDPDLHDYGTAIDPEAFATDWEEDEHAEEALILLPYLLLDELLKWQPGRTAAEVDHVGDRITDFYHRIGASYGEDPELLDLSLEFATEDLATYSPEEWNEEMEYVRAMYDDLSVKAQRRIDNFIKSW